MRKRSRLYYRILCYFLTLAVFVGAVACVTYYSFMRVRQQESLAQIQRNIEAVHKGYDNCISSLYSTANQFFANLKDFQILTGEELDESEILRSFQHMAPLSYGSIDTVSSFAYLNENRVIWTEGVSSADVFYTRAFIFSDYDLAYWQQFLQSPAGLHILQPTQLRKVSWLKQTGGLQRCVIPVVVTQYVNGEIGVLVFCLRVDDLAHAYESGAVFGSSQYVIIGSGGQLLHDPLELGQDGMSRLLQNSGTLRANGVRYAVVSSVHKELNWQVYCLTPISALVASNSFFLFIAASLCIGFVVVSLLLSLLYAKRIYVPISNLCSDVESGFGPREDTRQNELKYITSRIGEAARTLEESRERTRLYVRQCLWDAVEGRRIQNEGLLFKVLESEYGMGSGLLEVALYDAPYAPQTEGGIWLTHPSGIAVYVRESQNTPWPETAGRFGASAPFAFLRELEQAFVQAADAFLQLSQGGGHCVWPSMTRLENAVRLRDADGVQTALAELKEAMLCQPSDYRQRRAAVSEAYHTLIRLLDISLYQQCDALQHAAYDHISILLAPEIIDMEPLRRFALEVMTLLPPPETRVRRSNDLAQRLSLFIDEHYFEPLSLDIVAEKVGVSAKHASRVFKEEKNINITDYIALVRVEHAKRMLMEGMTVQAVAGQVGVVSQTTFIRMFKKYEGVTPSDYRSAHT